MNITWENKTGLRAVEGNRENQVRDSDMNDIKAAVNSKSEILLCQVVSDQNFDLNSAAATIGGVAITNNVTRIVLPAQTNAVENGVWKRNPNGTFSRDPLYISNSIVSLTQIVIDKSDPTNSGRNFFAAGVIDVGVSSLTLVEENSSDRGISINADWFGLPNGVDDTALIQSIHDKAVALGGVRVVWPKRTYIILGTVYLNKPDLTPVNWVGFAPELVKDNNTSELVSTTFYKPTAGVMFMVNLRANGCYYTQWYDYTKNFSIKGFVFKGTMDNFTEAFRLYRIRCKFEACLFITLDAGVYQDFAAPAGFSSSSTTPNTISPKDTYLTFTVEAGKPWHVGEGTGIILKFVAPWIGYANEFEARVISYVGTTIVVKVATHTVGSGSHSSWAISLVWDNYSDQSAYRNVQFFNAKSQGIVLAGGDVTVLEQIYYTYPSDLAVNAIQARGCQNLSINGFLHADPSNATDIEPDELRKFKPDPNMLVPGSSMIKLTRMDGFIMTNFTLERPYFHSCFELIQCKGWHISGIRPKFGHRTLLKTSRCRQGTFSHVSTEANIADGFVDFEDDLTDPSEQINFGQIYLNSSPPLDTREPTSNRVFSDDWKRNWREDLTNVEAVYDYGVTPGTANYYVPNNSIVTLPDATEDTLIQLPPTLETNSRVVLINRNTTAFRIQSIQGINLPNGSNFVYIPPASVVTCHAIIGLLETKAGTITCSTSSPVVTGIGTAVTAYLKTGLRVYNDAGALIGTVKSVASGTSFTLYENALVDVSGGGFKAYRVVWHLMDISGISNENIVFKSASASISTSEIHPYDSIVVYADASGGNLLITLPTVITGKSKTITVIRTDNTTNECSVRGNAGQLINDSSAYFLTKQYQQVSVKNSGTQWYGPEAAQVARAYSEIAYSTNLTFDVIGGFKKVTAITGAFTATITGLRDSANQNKINFILEKSTSNISEFSIVLAGAVLINQAKDAEILTSSSFALFGNNASKYLVSVEQVGDAPIVTLSKIATGGKTPNDCWELTNDFENSYNSSEYPYTASSPGTGASTSGTGATTLYDPTSGRVGIKILETGTQATGYASISTRGQMINLDGGGVLFKASVNIPIKSAVGELTRLRIGLGDSATADFIDGVYFEVTDVITCRTASNSTRTDVVTASALTDGVWSELMIIISATGTQAKFYLDGISIATTTTNIPKGTDRYTGLAAQFLKETGTTTRVCFIDFIHSRKLFINRR